MSLHRAYSFGAFCFFSDSLLYLVGFKILFFCYCLPKTISLEGLPNLLLHELEDFADFARNLVLMYILNDNVA